jgi:nicotinamidase-related amidase
MLAATDTALLVVDVQGRLARLIADAEAVIANIQRMIRGARALSVPILWAEQNPAGLGPTIAEIADLLPQLEPIPKTSFSCAGSPRFMASLGRLERRQVLVVGIEAHVCVYQSALDLVEAGYAVDVVEDAVGSRAAANKAAGLRRLAACGVGVTTTEIALFELLGDCEHPAFREVQAIIR